MQSHSEQLQAPEAPLPSFSDDDLAVTPDPACQSLEAATPIQTSLGLRPVHELEVGQHVLTRSGTYKPITGIDHTRFTKRHLQDNPDLAPIRFDPGALPDTDNGVATLVSPDCPVAVSQGAQGSENFAARAFCDGGLIRWVIPDDGIHYIRLHFAAPQEICASGIWVALAPEDHNVLNMTRHVPKLVQEIRIFRPLRD